MTNKEIQTFYTTQFISPHTANKAKISDFNKISKEQLIESIKNEHKYETIGNLGTGGMGEVDLSKDISCLRKVAVKTLSPELLKDSESILRFAEEAQIAAQLEHPNIIPIYDLAVNSNGIPYYTMKHIRGENLRDILTEVKSDNEDYLKKYPYTVLLRILIKVCNAISFSCAKGVLHRDLKLENIMIGEYGEVIIVDWGLAKVIDKEDKNNCHPPTSAEIEDFLQNNRQVQSIRSRNSLNLSLNNTLVGTPEFMPPERFFGHADEKSEVYSLGAILYSILSLENLYKENDIKELIRKISKGNYKPLEEYNDLPHFPKKSISDSLIVIANKALELEPNDRYESIQYFKRDLEAYLMGFAPKAENASFSKTFRLLIARHKNTASVLLGLIVILVTVSLFFTYKIMKEQQHAEMEFNIAKKLEQEASTKAKIAFEKEEELKKKISQLQDNAPVFYENAVNLLHDQKPEKALQNITQALNLQPDMQEALALRGSIYLALGQHRKALKALNAVKQYAPYIKEDIKYCQELKRTPKENLLDWHLRLFRHFSTTNRLSEALMQLEKLQSLDNYDKLLIQTWRKRLSQTSFSTVLKTIKLSALSVKDGLFELKIDAKNIYDLSPIKHMPISKLTISNSNFTNLSFVQHMPLAYLDISSCQFSSLEPLRGKQLTHLIIADTPINSLEPVNDMPVKYLNISGTTIQSLDNTNKMPLNYLNISNTPIRDLTPVSGKKLYNLLAENSQVISILPLKSMPLYNLVLKNTLVQSLAGINDLKNLVNLNLEKTQVYNLKRLINCPNLKTLNINNTPVRSLRGLHETKLTKLYASNTNFANLKFLNNLKIEVAYLAGTAIKDLSPIATSNLQKLNLNGCLYADFSSLKGADKLHELHMKDCNLFSLRFATNLHSLKKLNVSYNQIKTIAPLRELRHLEHLNLESNPITSLFPLRDMKSLRSLCIATTQVEELTPLTNLKLQVLKLHNNHNIMTLEPLQNIQTLKTLTLPRKRKDYHLVKGLKNITGISDSYLPKKPSFFWGKLKEQLKLDVPEDVPKTTE